MKPINKKESNLRKRFAHPHSTGQNTDQGERIAKRRWKKNTHRLVRRTHQADDRSALDDSRVVRAARVVDQLLENKADTTRPFPGASRQGETFHGGKRSTWGDERNLGKWWGPQPEEDDYVAQIARRQDRSDEQSRLQTAMNRVSKFEPQSKALLDLVLGRDDLLKERNARHRLEAELSKHGLSTDDVDDFIFKTRGSRDNMLNHLHVGPEKDNAGKALTPRCGACPHDFSQVQPGDLIGIKTRDGKTHYFSGPLGGLPTHIANPTVR
jgi:hypothetical protein